MSDENNPILDAMNDADLVSAQTGDLQPAANGNVTVIPESAPLAIVGDFVDERDPEIIARDKSINFAKDNIKDMMPAIAEAASDTLSVAKMLSSADHASAGAALLGQYLKAQTALVTIEKIHDDMRKRDKKGEVPQVQNQTLNVFAGTTADLQRIMKDLKIGDTE